MFHNSNSFGDKFRVTDAGESHGVGYVIIIDGCPAGISLSEEDLQIDLDKRRPGKTAFESARSEMDKAKIYSGVFEGKTLGTPISVVVKNNDQQSKDYKNLENIFRPGHADYSYFLKNGHRDHRGGGRSSARQTLSRVIAGSIARKILIHLGYSIQSTSYVQSVGSLSFESELTTIDPSINAPIEISNNFKKLILDAKKEGDSLGSQVITIIENVPKGLGDSFYGSLKAALGFSMFSLPAITALEFGSGVKAVSMKGSQHNDELYSQNGEIYFKTNNHSGILGGISTGEKIVMKSTLKPPSSINKEQHTVDKTGKKVSVTIEGRHDPCLAPRFCPIAEAMCYMTLLNFLL